MTYAEYWNRNFTFTWYYNPFTNEVVRAENTRLRDREALEGQGARIIIVQKVGVTNPEYWSFLVNSWLTKNGITPKAFRI